MTAFSFPIATALRTGLKTYSWQTFKEDFTAGLIVSLIALPLSMALSIAVGLPPQNGLYTAIVAGIVCALLGGSATQVSGPTAAFVVIIAPIVAQYGLRGIIWCQILAGALLIVLGTARLGRLVTYVPHPVTTGFTAGIAVVIATLSLNDFFGLGIGQLKGEYVEKVATIAEHMPHLKWQELSVGLVSLLTIIFFPKLTRKIPSPVAGITLASLLAWFFAQQGIAIDTLESRFSFALPEGGTGHGIPPYPPSLHWFGGSDLFAIPSWAEFRTLFSPALVIAALAALESLLSATVADSMAKTKHDPNAELNGIGIANIFSGLAMGIPATGAIARTATNIHAGARTPLASVIHAALILVYMLTMAPYISKIPMAALAALLLMTAYRMSHIHVFVRTLRIAPRSDVMVLLACFFLTVFIDMVAGVSVGMVLASFLFIHRAAGATQTAVAPASQSGDAGTMVFSIEGPLFFGSAEKALADVDFMNDSIKKLVIDLSAVPLIDMTGMVAMKTLLMDVAHEGRQVVLRGREDVTRLILSKLSDTNIARFVTAENV